MPITYSVNQAAGLIFEVWEGEISADVLREHWNGYLRDPEVMALRRTLVDMRRADIRFTGEQLALLVTCVAVPLLEGRDWTTAIVVERPVQFGVSRQYQVFADQYSRDCVFEDYDEALRWILPRS